MDGLENYEPLIPSHSHFLDTLSDNLRASGARAVVIAGRGLPPAMHALVHAINAALGSTGGAVRYVEPTEFEPALHAASLRVLVDAIDGGEVEYLAILDGNPAFDAPADLAFADKLATVPFSVHASLHEDETSQQCQWHIPAAHFLESWGDARARGA